MFVLPLAVLGRTGLKVTRLGYGAMEVRGSRIWDGRPVTDDQADRILNAVLDAGINFILRYILSHPDVNTTIVGTLSPDHLLENVEAALRGPLPPDVYAEAKRRLASVGAVPDPA